MGASDPSFTVVRELKQQNDAQPFCPPEVLELLERATRTTGHACQKEIVDLMVRLLLMPADKQCRCSLAGKQLFVLNMIKSDNKNDKEECLRQCFDSLVTILQQDGGHMNSIPRGLVVLGNLLKGQYNTTQYRK